MGRTVATITQHLNETEAMLQRFRRTLRRQDQVLFDGLMASAHAHITAISEAQALLPFEVALLAMLLEQHRQIAHLNQRVADLEQSFGMFHPDAR